MRIIGVVLNCPDWFNESTRLLDEAFAEYSWFDMLAENELVREMPVENGGDVLLPIYPREALGGAALRDSLPKLVMNLVAGSAKGAAA